jgi:hypothetical protein
MTKSRVFFLSVLGIGVVAAGFEFHIHSVRAARLDHVVAPERYFPPGTIWTHDASQDPLDPNSSAMINWLADAGGWGTGKMRVDFAMRVLQADETTPYVPFRKGSEFYTADSDVVSTFPLPPGGGIEGQKGYQCPFNTDDCHLIVVDHGKSKLYETFQANYADGALTANFVGVWDLSRVYPSTGRGDQCGSADAAGFPIAPLLFTADELAIGSINHAIRFVLPNPRIQAHVYVRPATHAGGPSGPPSAPPYGAHFRLKSTYNVLQLKPAAQVVARAMQKYGMFLADGGSIALTAQSDADTAVKYSDVDFHTHDLESLSVTDFEVVDGGPRIPLTYGCVRNP